MLAATDIVDDDVIDSDTVLDADDLKKPDPTSLRSITIINNAVLLYCWFTVLTYVRQQSSVCLTVATAGEVLCLVASVFSLFVIFL